MYLGQVVETGALGDVIRRPRHPYLQALLTAVPIPDPDLTRQHRELPPRGMDLPDPGKAPPGVAFTRAVRIAGPACQEEEPQLEDIGGGISSPAIMRRTCPEWTPLSVG
ncbi:MAG: hypothetical protein M5R40_11850 [Anaerolineae bacterium]|nr:hypothetical protein [Anaerolineae bacterium]